MNRLNLVGAIILGMLLTGCQTSAPTSKNRDIAAETPANHREQVVQYFKKSLKDPYSVRDAEISDKTVIFVGLINGTNAPGVCVRMNAKNSWGAYTGVETSSVAFRNGQIFLVQPPLFDTCSKVNWSPLPELNGAG